MKPMRIFLILALLTGTALAQQSDGREKERMIFPGGPKGPAASPTPAALPTPNPARRLDKAGEAMDMFFLALKANQVSAAYDALVKDTIIAHRADDVTALKEKTMQALDGYGPISGYEVVDEKIVGSSLLRRTCISLNADLPLRWRFYFYKSEGTWRLVDLRIDDALVELFEESGRSKK